MRTAFVAVAFLSLGAGLADAHIHLTSPKSRTDSELGDQKAGPCGVAGQVRDPARVTTFKPAQTITVTWKETQNHDGYYRIAFQPNGDKFSIPPAGPGGGFPTANQTGQIDGTTGAHILADKIADGQLTTTVTLPNMECNNCTLQFIQVMIDPLDTTYTAGDIYFNCANLTLSNSTPPPVDPPPGDPPDAGTPDDGTAGAGATNSGKINGGCAATGDANWLVALATGLLARRRRVEATDRE